MGGRIKRKDRFKAQFPTSAEREAYLRATHDKLVSSRAGKKLNAPWAEQFKKAGYKYVFTEVPMQGWEDVRPGGFPGDKPKPPVRRLTKFKPTADVVFGNSLDDLHWFESKAQPTSGRTTAQKMGYPAINDNGGIFAPKKGELPVNHVDGKPVDLNRVKIEPNRGYIGHKVDLSAVSSGQRDLPSLLEERRAQIRPGPKPTPHLELEDSRLITDRGTSNRLGGGPGEAGEPPTRGAAHPPAVGTTHPPAAGMAHPTGVRPPASRLGRTASALSRTASVTARTAGKVAITAIRGVRFAGAFAVRMIIPPLTPASLLFDLIITVAFELLERYFAREEQKNFEKQLEKLPKLIERRIQAETEKGAMELVRNVESGGDGFVFGRVTATVTKTTVLQGSIVPKEEWDITLDHFVWTPRRTPPAADESEGEAPDAKGAWKRFEKKTHIYFTIEEPILTPFDYFLGGLETLRQLMLRVYEEVTGVPGGIGPTPAPGDKRFLDPYTESLGWIMRLMDLLSRHRTLEDIVGTDWARPVRKNLVSEGRQVIRYIIPMLKQMVPDESLQPDSAYFELIGLARTLEAELDRASRSNHEGYYYRRAEPLPDTLNGRSYWTYVGWKSAPRK